MGENFFRVSYSSLMNGCPKCKSKNLYLICGEERGAICADCGWHSDEIPDKHAEKAMKSIREIENVFSGQNRKEETKL